MEFACVECCLSAERKQTTTENGSRTRTAMKWVRVYWLSVALKTVCLENCVFACKRWDTQTQRRINETVSAHESLAMISYDWLINDSVFILFLTVNLCGFSSLRFGHFLSFDCVQCRWNGNVSLKPKLIGAYPSSGSGDKARGNAFSFVLNSTKGTGVGFGSTLKLQHHTKCNWPTIAFHFGLPLTWVWHLHCSVELPAARWWLTGGQLPL